MTDPMRPRGPCFHRACGLLVALALSSGVGCFGDDDPVVDPDAGAPVDVGSSNDLGPAHASPDVADAADDLGSVVDVPRDAADAATDADAARPCDLDNDCRDPALPCCLVATGRCVRCLAGRGDCGRGQRCDPTTYTNVTGRGDPAPTVDDAIETFRKARKIAPHARVVKSVLRLFDELVKCDEDNILKDVRVAVEGRDV